jgi:hypothetical protein
MNPPRLMIGMDPGRPGDGAWAAVNAQLARHNVELLHALYHVPPPDDGKLLQPAPYSWEEEYAGMWEQILRPPLVRNGTEWVSDREAMDLDILRFAKAHAYSAGYGRLYDRRRVKRARRRAYRRKVLRSTNSYWVRHDVCG